MRSGSFLILLLLLMANASAQNIFVFNKQSGEPIRDVFFYNDQKTITGLTNELGIARIDDFHETDRLHFQHPAYEATVISIFSLKQMGYRIGLEPSYVDLVEVVVSANKWEANREEVPNRIEVIEKKDIRFENPATSADMLASGGQVYVQKTQLGGGSPMLRGFAANRILFIVDGVRMNNIIYRSGNLHNILQADVNSIENAEVIFGPGTNIYGSDALGGVIDFHTLRPLLGIDERWSTSGSAMARVASADFEKTIHADLNFYNNRWSMMASISYTDFDDLFMGNMHNDYATRPEYVERINGLDSIVANENPNKQVQSGYHQLNFIAKIKQQFTKDIDWTLSFYLTQTGDVPRYDRLIQYSGETLRYAEWYYHPQQWLMNSLEMNFRRKTRAYDHAVFTLAYQNVKEGRNDRRYRDEWLRKRDENVNIFSGNADFEKKLKWENHLFYGLELIYNHAESSGEQESIYDGTTEMISSRYPDGGSSSFQAGAYLSYKKNFSEKPFTFQAGMRFTYAYLNSLFNDTTFYKLPYESITLNNAAVTGSAGMTYRPGKWQFKANLSSGFRAPNLDDVAKIFDSEPGNVIIPNEDLQPEYLYNIDAGIIFGRPDNIRMEFTAFYSYLVNAIVRRYTTLNGQDSIPYDGEMSRVQTMMNAGSAYSYGATAAIDWRIVDFLSLRSIVTYITGEDDEGYPLRHAPPVYGSTTLSFHQNGLKLALSGVYNAEISYEKLALSERNKAYFYATDENGNPYSPGWWTLNFKGSYAFMDEVFILSLGVENILNYRYRPYSSGIAAPGRNFMAAFTYTF
ncbi:MAG: outer membrane beta-barrel protein [bacterium]